MPFNIRVSAAIALLALGSGQLQAAPPTIGGCQVFPANNFWNTPIDQLPVDAVNSTNWVNSIGANTRMHADWGNKLDDGSGFNEIIGYGIPFIAGPSPTVADVTFDVPEESDPFQPPYQYRIPSNAPVEGGAGSGGDMHVLSIDTTSCKLYELYFASKTSATTWNASSGAIFDLSSNALRPDGYTSADASGLAIFPGLVKWEEVNAGEIAHAIRFTATNIWGSTGAGHKYIWPATHWSTNNNNSLNPPMGARFRLKASFNILGFDPRTQVVLRAFKKYGLVLTDRGSNWYFSGTSNVNWPDIVIQQLNSNLIHGSDFEVVDTALLKISPTSALAVQVPGPPSNVVATAGNGQATFSFTAPADGGAPIGGSVTVPSTFPAYRVTCNPGAITGTGASSPVTVSGLSNGTPYSCSVAASNVTGFGAASGNTNVTPGQGVLSPNAPVDFNRNPIAPESVTITLTISNIGSGNTSALSISLTGPNAAAFAQVSTCSGQSLPPAGTCTIDLTWAPLVVGPYSATLTISGATTSPAIIPLSGFGIAPPSAPAIANAVPGNGQAWIFFAPPATDGESPITSYTATCFPGAGSVTATGNGSPILVTGLSNGTSYNCSVHAVNNAGNGAESMTASVTPTLTPAMGLTGVESRKFHIGTQEFGIAVQNPIPLQGNVSVEPRVIGAGHMIVFSFNNPVTNAGTATMTPAGTVESTVAVNNEVRVTVGNVPDNIRVTLSLSGVSDVNASITSAIVSMGFLVGDVNNSRSVNASDISAVKSRAGQMTNAGNFRFDLNASGSIAAQDVSLAKSRSGLAMP